MKTWFIYHQCLPSSFSKFGNNFFPSPHAVLQELAQDYDPRNHTVEEADDEFRIYNPMGEVIASATCLG